MTITATNSHHEDIIASRQIQQIAAYFGTCQLICGVLYLTCSIFAISQFDNEIVPVIDYGVNICSGLMMKFVLISSVINIILCTTVIILSMKAMFYPKYSALIWYSEILTFTGFIIIFICLSTIIASAISVFKQPENIKRQELPSEVVHSTISKSSHSNKGVVQMMQQNGRKTNNNLEITARPIGGLIKSAAARS